MTNEEAIEYLIDIPRSYGVRRDDAPCNAINIAINSIQENTKLKAEIKRLNGKSEMYRDMADSFCNSNIKLKAEIEELHNDLKWISEKRDICLKYL